MRLSSIEGEEKQNRFDKQMLLIDGEMEESGGLRQLH